MRKIFRTLSFILKRYYFALKIRSKDKISDRSFVKNELSENGFEVFDMHHLFENPKKLSKSLSQIQKQVGADGLDMSWQLPRVFWEEVLNSRKLMDVVRDYLGETARLDDAYLKTIRDGISSVSEGWHNDNVGYRLKLFIVFDTEGQAASTLVIPAKRPNLYRFKLIEDTYRLMFGRNDTAERPKEKAVNYSPGTCLLFDTNLTHRGGYAESKGVRHCVIIEFICRDKANHISGFAPCGPKQGKGRISIQVEEQLIKQSALIDSNILKKSGDNTFEYGLSTL